MNFPLAPTMPCICLVPEQNLAISLPNSIQKQVQVACSLFKTGHAYISLVHAFSKMVHSCPGILCMFECTILNVCWRARVCVCVCVCVHTRACVYACVRLCVYIHNIMCLQPPLYFMHKDPLVPPTSPDTCYSQTCYAMQSHATITACFHAFAPHSCTGYVLCGHSSFWSLLWHLLHVDISVRTVCS